MANLECLVVAHHEPPDRDQGVRRAASAGRWQALQAAAVRRLAGLQWVAVAAFAERSAVVVPPLWAVEGDREESETIRAVFVHPHCREGTAQQVPDKRLRFHV